MRRCLLFLLPAMFAGTFAHTQLVNNGATITVQTGATIKCLGAIINNAGGTIQNAGIVSADGEFRNESGSIIANNGTAGTYEATTKFINNGNAFTGINLRLIGSANTDSIKSGVGSSFANVNVAKAAGFTATLSDAMTVTGNFTFDNDNNRVIIEDENLIMGAGASFLSSDDNEFIVTNNTGAVTKQSLAAAPFVYPVGFAAGQFNPLTISNSGTSDNISVRCLQHVLDQGLTGSAVASDFANNAWVVTEALGGGSNLQLTGTWAAGDELLNFNRLKTGVARYNTGTDWDLPASNVLAATGSGPYTNTRNNITTTGVFAIADLDKVNTARLNLKVILQNAYSAGTMADGLRGLNLIPTTQPYNAAFAAMFTRVGVYDGSPSVNETVSSTTVFDVAITSDDIVDWVYISLQDGVTPATKLQTRAALIQRDGDIVEYDPITATYVSVRMPIDADGNYHLVVGHRNHLSIRTRLPQLLQEVVPLTYNFSDAQLKAYQDPAILALPFPRNNPAMKDLGGGVFAMWGGNINSNGNVRFTGLSNDAGALLAVLGGNQAIVLNNQYHSADLNMNGNIRYTGINNDSGVLLAVLNGNQAAIFSQHQ